MPPFPAVFIQLPNLYTPYKVQKYTNVIMSYIGRQWRNEPKHLGGTIFTRERSYRAGGGGEGGVSPPTVGSFFIFST